MTYSFWVDLKAAAVNVLFFWLQSAREERREREREMQGGERERERERMQGGERERERMEGE